MQDLRCPETKWRLQSWKVGKMAKPIELKMPQIGRVVCSSIKRQLCNERNTIII